MNDFLGSGRPGDERGFIHKKFLGLVSTVAGVASGIGVPFAGTVSRVTRRFAGSRARRPTVPRIETARVTQSGQEEKRLGAVVKFAPDVIPSTRGGSTNLLRDSFVGDLPCPPPLVLAPDGHCVARGSGHFQSHFGNVVGGAPTPVGDAVMGRYGAALTPGSLVIDRAVCLKGMQLGDDGLCYNKSQISNKQRMWPAGRKPLLSGGDMRAIGVAARAGRRLEGATKRLQRLGMMKKPSARRGPHQRLLEAHVTK